MKKCIIYPVIAMFTFALALIIGSELGWLFEKLFSAISAAID